MSAHLEEAHWPGDALTVGNALVSRVGGAEAVAQVGTNLRRDPAYQIAAQPPWAAWCKIKVEM